MRSITTNNADKTPTTHLKANTLRATKLRLARWIKLWHYWVGALVGLQLLIWLGTGIYFNITPHAQLKGMEYNHSHHAPHEDFNFNSEQLLTVQQVLAPYPPQQQLALTALNGTPVYVLTQQVTRYQRDCQQQVLIHGYSGEPVIIDAALASNLASASYMGPGAIIDIKKRSAPIDEWPKECNPVWQINMDDELNTRIYINAINGQLVGHKNTDTELADLMFKLHFMDYLHQGSFNNPFSWLFALMTLLLSLSGVYWVLENVIKKRYRLAKLSKGKAKPF
ncbi:PepSY domain-containing protein [Shewanella youngdeokensis]|uniref:PepSY domain-containing protein n=1 Tax=Shewanella youngdeokensis TaxID=2999068 RepID=A0ABZ0JX51_9GAMM|nr:PepSY domain-containing protein [Shewanella sp. DAU334]